MVVIGIGVYDISGSFDSSYMKYTNIIIIGFSTAIFFIRSVLYLDWRVLSKRTQRFYGGIRNMFSSIE